MSCQICYTEFSLDSDDTTPRRIVSCQHVVCANCISSDFTAGSPYYCPQCGQDEYNCDSIDGFSQKISITEASQTDEFLDDEQTTNESESQANSDSPEEVLDFSSSSTQSRMVCSFIDCTNKSLKDSNLCMRHGNRADLTEADQIASDLKNATFRFKTTKKNKIEPVLEKEMNSDDLKAKFIKQKRLDLSEAMDLIDKAKAIMIHEPNILYLEAPLLAVGDIHGQFFDLLNLIEEGGQPGEEQYIFLGDYVDRGSFSCEVMFYLLSLKVANPGKIWLLRGNHECATVSGHFGFKHECKMKYGMNVYYRFLLLFQTMPLAAVISTAYGDIFACHGGISPSFRYLDDIEAIDRFVEPEANTALLDILWSDPMPEENVEEMTDEEYETFMNIDFQSNPSRGCSYIYGYKAIREFLDTNNLVCIVRAHEVQEEGFKKHFDPQAIEERMRRIVFTRGLSGKNGSDIDNIQVGETDFPPLLTIFSAPNYCDRYQNRAAILRIDIGLDGFHAIQYECVKHPEPEIVESQTDNYLLAIISACPYMPNSLHQLVKFAVELGPDLEQMPSSIRNMEVEPDQPKEDDVLNDENQFTINSNEINNNSNGLKPSKSKSHKGKSKIGKQNSNKNIKSKEEKEPVYNLDGTNHYSYIINPQHASRCDQIPPPAAIPSNVPIPRQLPFRHDRRNQQQVFPPGPVMKPTKKTPKLKSPKSQERSDIFHHNKTLDMGNEAHPCYSNIDPGILDETRKLEMNLEDCPRPIAEVVNTLITTKHTIDSHTPKPMEVKSPQNNTSDSKAVNKSIRKSQVERERGNDYMSQHSYALIKFGEDQKESFIIATVDPDTAIVTLDLISRLEDFLRHKEEEEALKHQFGIRSRLSSIDKSVDRLSIQNANASSLSSAHESKNTHQQQQQQQQHQRNYSAPSKFEEKEILGLKLMFSLFDRSGLNVITYEDLVAYGEETGDLAAIRDAGHALDVVDIDGDGRIGLVDFIRFATRLKNRRAMLQYRPLQM